MIDFLLCVFVLCVAPVVLAVLGLRMKGTENTPCEDLMAKFHFTSARPRRCARRIPTFMPKTSTEGVVRGHRRASFQTGSWEAEASLMDPLSD